MRPRILIVDDNSLVRKLLRDCLELEGGWQVCAEASNGKEGVEKAQEVHPDLIVLDLSMPVMNGLEAARILKRLMPSVPLLMCTCFHTSNLEYEALEAGISKVITKSEAVGNLITSIRSFLLRDAA
jgi:DNA-binding NarL/FixJ family response regulator